MKEQEINVGFGDVTQILNHYLISSLISLINDNEDINRELKSNFKNNLNNNSYFLDLRLTLIKKMYNGSFMY